MKIIAENVGETMKRKKWMVFILCVLIITSACTSEGVPVIFEAKLKGIDLHARSWNNFDMWLLAFDNGRVVPIKFDSRQAWQIGEPYKVSFCKSQGFNAEKIESAIKKQSTEEGKNE